MLIGLIVVAILQCVHISKHHTLQDILISFCRLFSSKARNVKCSLSLPTGMLEVHKRRKDTL